MFLKRLNSSDSRFHSLTFHEGLNILVADRTDLSAQGDSRNSIGKTSFVKILRYLMGGDLPPEFKAGELGGHQFTASLELPGAARPTTVGVTRGISPATRVQVAGWPTIAGGVTELSIAEWRELMARGLFHIPDTVERPTVGQLWAQLIRTYFGSPTKVHQSEPDWESGVRIGFFLGLSPTILGQAGDIARLTNQASAIRKAVREGAIEHFDIDEPSLRAKLATARRGRDRLAIDLRSFKVDAQYAEHQQEADRLTGVIQKLNDEGLALERRLRELNETLSEEAPLAEDEQLKNNLLRVYSEAGVVLPEIVARRYDEVAIFHESVIRNRRLFLEQELHSVQSRLETIAAERRQLDTQRSRAMQLLSETVALDTFRSTQQDLATRDAEVAELERRLANANSIATISDTIKLRTAELKSSVRTEMSERQSSLDDAISLFSELGAEIYNDRQASLLLSPTDHGLLKVEPRISGDASTGVRSVETFMLDMVCEIEAIKIARAPRILVHDSHLFDSIDGRQIASCLNIGARLAEQYAFQYIVTLNSDVLENVERQSDGAFDAAPHVLAVRLTDETDAGGLFGFRFG